MKELVNPTRAKIISFLRRGERTVTQLAGEVRLTDNAIRAHLEALQRQGLVYQSGFRTGPRKPHHVYKLTAKAEQIFFEGCEPLLSHMLAALVSRLPRREVRNILREAGRRLAVDHRLRADHASKRQRIDHALALLEELGGKAEVQQIEGRLLIQSASCPWAIIVAKHDDVCLAAEALLSELIGVPVKEHCVRGASPRCTFHIQAPVA